MDPEANSAHEALMQFLYLAPIGLVQTTLSGHVEMLNPMSARLLMPLSRHGGLDNLFEALDGVAPELRELVGAFEPNTGTVCEGLHIQLPQAGALQSTPRVLSLSLLKLDGTHLMASLADVSAEVERERRGMDQRLSQAARIDTLTQMPNRAAVRDLLRGVLAEAKAGRGGEFAVLYLSCDRFKQVNELHGYTVGDEVLGLVAGRIRAGLRQKARQGSSVDGDDQMAARLGGDEFVVVINDLARADNIHSVAQRLLDMLGKPYGVGHLQLSVGVSMGVVLKAQAAGDADEVLLDAGIAMTDAKRTGGSRYTIFEPSMKEQAARRGAVEADLRRALSEDQLFVVYQPVVGMQGSSGLDWSRGVEALVRWRHPTRGVVPPSDFIPVAEECGLIGALGDFVLATACRQMALWRQQLGERAPQHMAVNLSRAQLKQPGWAAHVEEVLRATGLEPWRLQLEVTESLAAQDEEVQARLHELKRLGLTLALDDFGTGYSSLASLHLLPVDTVKIDRSFVSQSDTNPHHRVLIEATIRVAKSLGMNTVAEGIETESQAAVVRGLQCDKGQGYLYSKPLLPDDLVQWLERAWGPQPLRRDAPADPAQTAAQAA